MRNAINIDATLSWAMRREIGERLQQYLRAEPELPASIRKQVDRLQQLEGPSPSIIPAVEQGLENERSKDVSGGDRSRFTRWWWRKA
jgi:hypothetical protein